MPLSGARPRVGSHVRVSGGLARAGLAEADALEAEAIQVFLSNPRSWVPSSGHPQDDRAFRTGCEQRGLVAYAHAPYLVNLGSPTRETVRRSAATLAHTLARARVVGARGVVVHTGSAVTADDREQVLARVREVLLPLLDALPDDGPDLLLEPTAGQGRSLCATVDDLGPYLEQLERHERVGVCLDTCHAFAAGHDLAVPGGMRATVDRLVRVAGPGRLRLVHANDSKDPLGSGRDRHERIGRGHIGEAAFAELLAHPAVAGVALVLETPGDRDAHAEDVARLKNLRPR